MEKLEFIGVEIDNLNKKELLNKIEIALFNSSKIRVEGLNVYKYMQALDDPSLSSALKAAEIVHVDGVGVYWAGLFLGLRISRNYPGIDLMGDILSICQTNSFSVYLLGASASVVAMASEKLCQLYPNVEICGYRDGYFDEEEEGEIIAAINSKKPNVLLIGISSPKKEMFISRNWDKLDVNVSLGVGGAFDVVSGKVQRAPKFMQNLGLEWLYRFAQEPLRLFRRYTIENIRFFIILLRSKVYRREK
jgi:N-acetylglucosaminyldiphosphoundecaprenol N-acetyl-beta-D-mannosaminyltransferase